MPAGNSAWSASAWVKCDATSVPTSISTMAVLSMGTPGSSSSALALSVSGLYSAGQIFTVAGSAYAQGYLDGIGTSALFSNPSQIAFDYLGNLLVADQSNYRIRKISPSFKVTTLAGDGSSGNTNGFGTSASFPSTQVLAVDPSGNVYVGGCYSNLRKISQSGSVSMFGDVYSCISALAADSSGTIYVAETYNGRVTVLASSGVQIASYSGPPASSGSSSQVE
jgi:hypothetical protein